MEYKLYVSEYAKILNLSKYVNSFKTKVAMLCSYECSLIEPIILTELYKEDICVKYFDCGYNQIYQNCAQLNGNLYKFSPHFIIINLRLEDIFTKLFDNYLEEIQYIDKQVEEIKNYICGCVDNIRKKLDSHILFCSFCNANIVTCNFFDSNNRYGINNMYKELNIFLTELVKKYEGFYVINVESIVSYIGYKNILDNRMYKLFKNPYRIEYYIELGKAISNAILCIFGKRKKCIIVDLDNTLWKGILEEDGVGNLEPNIEIQKELLYLKSTGILLAINSKNEEKSAVDAMKRINGMLMDDKNFIIKKINYNRKDFNCIEIAKELNISLNSCVFLDDSQMEIDLINTNCPEIKTFKITNNILDSHKFHNDICLDFFDLTKEDKERSSIYNAEKKRSQKKSTCLNYNEFLKSLNMKAYFFPLSHDNIIRIEQLIKKTSQFNLTAKKYDSCFLKNYVKYNYLVFGLRVEDKFGDLGIIAAIIINKCETDKFIIENIVLSCRALNRNLEYALMKSLLEYAKEKKVKVVEGKFLNTGKNKIARDFYLSCGFKNISDNNWYFDLEAGVDNLKTMCKFIKIVME